MDTGSAIIFMVFMFLIIFGLYVVPSIIVMAKLYSKAGKPGWAAIVPVYNSMVMAEIAQKPVWAGVVVGVSGLVGNGARSESLSAVVLIFNLVAFVLGLWILNSFIKQYDRGIGFWVLWIFLPIVAVFLVDKANYKNAQQVPTAPQAAAPVPPSPQPLQPVASVAPSVQTVTPAPAPPQTVAPSPAMPQPTPTTGEGQQPTVPPANNTPQ